MGSRCQSMFLPRLSSRKPKTLNTPSEMRFAALMISCSVSGQRCRNSDNVCSFESNDAKKRGSFLRRRCSTRSVNEFKYEALGESGPSRLSNFIFVETELKFFPPPLPKD